MLPVGTVLCTTLLARYGKVYHTWPSTSTTVREVLHTGHGVSTVVLEYLPILFPLIKITNSFSVRCGSGLAVHQPWFGKLSCLIFALLLIVTQGIRRCQQTATNDGNYFARMGDHWET